MGKIIKKENIRVEVYPEKYSYGICIINTEKDEFEQCKILEKQIKRHIDDCHTCLTYDTNEYCEYCGAIWTEDTPHNGGCCSKDIDLMDECI